MITVVGDKTGSDLTISGDSLNVVMFSRFISFPDESATRKESAAALSRAGEMYIGNTTRYLWPIWEGVDRKWYMEVIDDPSTLKYRNASFNIEGLEKPERLSVEV